MTVLAPLFHTSTDRSVAVRAWSAAAVMLSVLVMTLLRRCHAFGDNWIGWVCSSAVDPHAPVSTLADGAANTPEVRL
jgi:hypothetical protein